MRDPRPCIQRSIRIVRNGDRRRAVLRRHRWDLRRHLQRGALDGEDQPPAAIAATRASSIRNSDEINGSGQRRDLGYEASDFIH
jgi:hypothetical protein